MSANSNIWTFSKHFVAYIIFLCVSYTFLLLCVFHQFLSSLFFFFFKAFIYSWGTEREREREAETQAEGEAGSMQGARCGTRSSVSRITSWAEGSAKLLSHPGCPSVSFMSVRSLIFFNLLLGSEHLAWHLAFNRYLLNLDGKNKWTAAQGRVKRG